jgi:hypothetical protein
MAQINLLTNKTIINAESEEYFNTLRTNIQALNNDKKVIMVSSVLEGEGKTMAAVNLAVSFAELGLKTMLVDANTRNSSMPGYFKFKSNICGLTNYLTGTDPIEDTIYDADVKNLNIIPSGARAKNPTEILQNKNYNIMIEVFREYYDVIIIDTPSVGAVIDAAVVAKSADGFIMVAEANRVKKKDLESCIEELEKAGSECIGVVLNKFY